MPQIELSEQELQKVDELIKNGVFIDRNQALRTGLESLSDLSNEEVKKMKNAQAKVNSYLEINVGNLLFAGAPIKVVVNGKELYRIAAKGSYKGKRYDLGYIYLDVNSLEIDKELSTSSEKVSEEADRIVKENEGEIL